MIRVASFQATPKHLAEERLSQVLEALEYADREHIDFLCLPEGFLTGYYAARELAEQTAIEIDSQFFREFIHQTASFDVTFIIGFNEREGVKIVVG